jgi:hypothetical protein
MERKLLYSLLAVEHARRHLIASWPPSAYKEASLKAIESSIQSLTVGQTAVLFRCMACLKSGKLATMPSAMRPAMHSEASKAA